LTIRQGNDEHGYNDENQPLLLQGVSVASGKAFGHDDAAKRASAGFDEASSETVSPEVVGAWVSKPR
jgi:hypothetical protein